LIDSALALIHTKPNASEGCSLRAKPGRPVFTAHPGERSCSSASCGTVAVIMLFPHHVDELHTLRSMKAYTFAACAMLPFTKYTRVARWTSAMLKIIIHGLIQSNYLLRLSCVSETNCTTSPILAVQHAGRNSFLEKLAVRPDYALGTNACWFTSTSVRYDWQQGVRVGLLEPKMLFICKRSYPTGPHWPPFTQNWPVAHLPAFTSCSQNFPTKVASVMGSAVALQLQTNISSGSTEWMVS
jgi:hypothetical protein